MVCSSTVFSSNSDFDKAQQQYDKEQMPQSAFTADEETVMYFFMPSALHRHNYKAIGLKDAEKRAKADAKGKKFAKTAEKAVKNGADTTATKSKTAMPKVGKEQPQSPPHNTETKETKPTVVADSKALAVISKSQQTAATVPHVV